MVRQFSALAEVRKHPGITGGVIAVLAGIGIAALLLNQRTGPTRYETLRRRVDPRGWIDTDGLRSRFDGLAESVRESLSGAGERAGAYGDDARDWLKSTRQSSGKTLKQHGKTARRYADDAGRYAKDHAKEGGALLALATIAAAVGAAVLESRQPDSKVRRIGKF